jgi:hypothetical protein
LTGGPWSATAGLPSVTAVCTPGTVVGMSAPRPSTVTASFWLYLVTVVLSILSSVTGAAWMASLRDDQSVGAGPLIGTVLALVIAVVQLVVVFRMRSGHNWARIVLLVVSVLSVLGLGFTVTGVMLGLVRLVGLLTPVMVIVATILMFVPASNRYFRRH